MICGKSLREKRTERKLSQEKLGRTIGLDGQYIHNLEYGIRADIRATTLIKLCDALNCTADYLLGRDGKRKTA
jgi:transcriptional regulator with XRE-family HTH domain